jgi:hypothetical protein
MSARLVSGRLARFYAALAGCAALAACADGVAVRNQVYVSDMRTHLSAASAYPMPVVILNEPFADDRGGAQVIAAMQKGQGSVSPRQNFAALPAGQSYRVVLTFNGAPTGGNSCAGSMLSPPPSVADRIAIHATFCLGTKLLSEVTAAAAPIASPQDPQFARLMTDVLSGLFPANHPMFKDSWEDI